MNDPSCEALHNAFNHGKIAESERLHLELIKQTREYEEERLEILRKIHEKVTASQADAAKVVHGEWVVCGDGEYVPFVCSACGKTTSWYHKQTANYCPNCGAKMDGERKENG